MKTSSASPKSKGGGWEGEGKGKGKGKKEEKEEQKERKKEKKCKNRLGIRNICGANVGGTSKPRFRLLHPASLLQYSAGRRGVSQSNHQILKH